MCSRCWIGLLIVSAILIAGGCSASKPRPQDNAKSSDDGSTTARASKRSKSESSMPAIPQGAAYTIYCQTISGGNHVAQAKQTKQNLIETSGMKDWYVVHGEQESTLYYGFYRSADAADPDGRRARDERARLDAMTDAAGDRPFRYSMVVPLNSPDPLAPPEWNLENAPADRFWSLQICAYKDSPQRKLMAVESVRDARAMGVEAYYYHGENISHVCIGAWPRSAIREQESDQALGDPSKPLIVLPPGLPDDLASKISLPDRADATRVMPRVEVVDPTLITAMKEYPHHAVNAELQMHKVRNQKTGQVETVPEPSLIVVIPRRAPSILAGDGSSVLESSAPTPVPAPQPSAPQPASGTGRLKSIGG